MSGHTDLDVEEVDVTVRALLTHFPTVSWDGVHCECGWTTRLPGKEGRKAHAQHVAPLVIYALEEWADRPRAASTWKPGDDPWSDPKYAGAHDDPPFE